MDNGASSYRRFLDGDDQGMEELIRDYKDGLLLYLNKYIQSISCAEDCVQETFIRLAIKKPKFRGHSSFKTWLYAIGRNEAISFLRKDKSRCIVSLEDAEEISSKTDLERDYLKDEQKLQLHQAIGQLKPEYQQVLWLTVFEGFRNEEAAKIMRKSKKQIENLLYNAKKALRTEMESEGYQYEGL